MSESNESFVHLQCHTEFSLLEGALRIPRLIKATAEHGMPAVAITDNGTMYGTIDFYLKAKAAGINPIIGCDMFLTPDITVKERSPHRLVFLCKDYEGYQNLIKLVSISHLDGFYYRPRIDLEHIKRHSGGLICISPGRRGPIASALSSHQFDNAKHMAETLKVIFNDDFYLGLQRSNLPFEDLIISGSQQLSESLNIPLVALNDVFYHRRDLAYIRDVLFCIQTGKQLDSDARAQSDTQELYFKSPEEMRELFLDMPEACDNTLVIASKCDVKIETDQVLLPRFDCPDNLESATYLEQLVWKGIHEKYDVVTDEIKDRIEFELNIINTMHYANYFLIIYDFLSFCTESKIPVGPGRGSAAGSIVSYALDITKVDPIRYKLLFERFLNPERVSMPDVDIDFCIRRRNEVIEYIIQRYGQDCVSQIITFGTMQSRAVIRDVGRVLNIPLSEIDYIAKLIPAIPGQNLSISDAIKEIEALKRMYEDNPDYKRLLDIGMELEGQARHSSTHAAGVVISRDPLTSVVPLVKNDGQVATQFAMADIEKIGLLKMDILGLRNLTVLQDAVDLIKKTQDITIDLETLDIEDQATYDLLCDGKTVGVFQLESKGMRTLIKDLKPKVFEDIIALLALYRPGPLGSGMVNDFISNKSGRTTVKYPLPELEPILNETYGMIVYQEQVMQIASVIGGFSLGQADMLRRAMGKKKKDVMDEMRETFLEGAQKKKIDADKASAIFELCYKFAEYGFNKSHSAAYALISFQTAYLKANFPVEYMTALLSSVLSNTDKTILYIQECKDMGMQVWSPSINHSVHDFCIEDSSIRFGLGAIKNIGEGAIQSIIENRKEGPYKDLGDFCKRVDLKQVNKRVIESLIRSGAADELDDRGKLLGIYEKVLERAVALEREQKHGQVGLFGGADSTVDFMMHSLEDEGHSLTVHEKCRMQKEYIGFYLTGHPLDEIKEILDQMSHHSGTLTQKTDGKVVTITGLLNEFRQIKTKTNKDMIIGTLEDLHGSITVMMFESHRFSELSLQFKLDHIVTVKGKVKYKQDDVAMMIEDIVSHAQLQNLKSIFVDIEYIDTEDTFKTLKEHCSKFKGHVPLYFKNGQQTVLAHKKYWLDNSDECIQSLTAIVGKGRHWVI